MTNILIVESKNDQYFIEAFATISNNKFKLFDKVII